VKVPSELLGVRVGREGPGRTTVDPGEGRSPTVSRRLSLPEDQLLPACEAGDVGVIARVPFDEGALTGRIRPGVEFEPGDWRHDYFRDDRLTEVAARTDAIIGDLGIELAELPDLALRFAISPGAVTAAIPGMRSARHVEANVAAAEAGPLDTQTLAILRNHRWEKNFYVPETRLL